MGHVRDLPEDDFGVDVEHDFKPTYVKTSGRDSVIREIKKAARDADGIYLATDPDREGEAISWHLVEAAGLTKAPLKRVVFHEITREAIDAAFADPREIDMRLVNAQQARRILDRIVGYRLSPILWGKVKRGLSAGRVQSVALRLVVDREREIEAFKPREYWAISAQLAKPGATEDDAFKAALHAIDGQKGRLRVGEGDEASRIVADLEVSAFQVRSVVTKEVKARPSPPFITSTLQQEAARRLGFNAERTMRAAQRLYEGVQLGEGEPVGLITYMRTDSTSLSAAALTEAVEFVRKEFGPEYAPRQRTYRTRSKLAQEAHEAIRPTLVARTPESVATHLGSDQRRLYELVWRRMVASQMADAVSDSTTADIAATGGPSGAGYTLRATGNVLKFPGFRRLYLEAKDDGEADEDDSDRLVPLDEGEALERRQIDSEQRFTQPPPRFSEAMLIRTLEEKGIGRPSTYASIVATIERREYVVREKRRFKPTRLGMAVSDFLTEWFPDIMDPDFTSGMEESLDAIARGDAEWVPVLDTFYEPFDKQVERTKNEAERIDRNALAEPTDESCEVCERPMVIKDGRYGKFLSCTGFPECRHSRPLRIIAEAPCPESGGELVQRRGGRRNRLFWGCSDYPDCEFATRYTPIKEPCPSCGKLLVQRGNGAMCLVCDWRGALPDSEESEPASGEREAVEV